MKGAKRILVFSIACHLGLKADGLDLGLILLTNIRCGLPCTQCGGLYIDPIWLNIQHIDRFMKQNCYMDEIPLLIPLIFLPNNQDALLKEIHSTSPI